METLETPANGLVQKRLPWIVAGAALLVFLVSVNRWVRLESLVTVARVGGWEWGMNVQAPLYFLLTAPLGGLPVRVQPIALNLFSAVLAALTLACLARSVALLPLDRTREARERLRGEGGVSNLRWAWVPVVLAVGLVGFQRTFWEHATMGTGEMLDLLLFACLILCLLEFRVERRDTWLWRYAVVYGLAVTNNYAMLAFAPCALVALIWVKGWEFFQTGFLLRLAGAGVAGLLGYLILPLAGLMGAGDRSLGFWEHLRAVLGTQRLSLRGLPPYVVLLLSFTSLVPALVMGIRLKAGMGDVSVGGTALNTLVLRLVYAVLLAGCGTVFFDPKWSARVLGQGYPLLPFYYLAALGVAYFVGYFLVLTRPVRVRVRLSGSLFEQLGKPLAVLAMAAAVALPLALAQRNLPFIRATDGRQLGRLADQILECLPAEGAYVLGDQAVDLLLVDARQRLRSHPPRHVLAHSRSLEYLRYHDRLQQRHPGRWPSFPNRERLVEPIESATLVGFLSELAASNRVYYLNPSFGYYFELLEQRPRGLVLEMRLTPADTLVPPSLTAEELAWNEKFWQGIQGELGQRPPLKALPDAEEFYVAQTYGRALNTWGVALHRAGRAADAVGWFELALRLNGRNVAAKANLAFNPVLAKGVPADYALSGALELTPEYRTVDQVLLFNGPVDEPKWRLKVGETFAQGGLYRQALAEFTRLGTWFPADRSIRLWRENMEIMTRFRLGDTAGAEQQAIALQKEYPRDENALEALTQIYLLSGRLTNALATVDRQLQINPANQRALLNMAAFHIQLSNYPAAIPPLDALLKAQPDNYAALLNRAIAHLQSGQVDPAAADYNVLLKVTPDSLAVQYGLGEIAYQRKDRAAAIRHYEQYLKLGTKGSEEYSRVSQRLEALRRGG